MARTTTGARSSTGSKPVWATRTTIVAAPVRRLVTCACRAVVVLATVTTEESVDPQSRVTPVTACWPGPVTDTASAAISATARVSGQAGALGETHRDRAGGLELVAAGGQQRPGEQRRDRLQIPRASGHE